MSACSLMSHLEFDSCVCMNFLTSSEMRQEVQAREFSPLGECMKVRGYVCRELLEIGGA